MPIIVTETSRIETHYIIATLAAQVGMERQRDGRWFVSACGGYNTYDAAVWPLTSGDLTWETFVRNVAIGEIDRLRHSFRTRGRGGSPDAQDEGPKTEAREGIRM